MKTMVLAIGLALGGLQAVPVLAQPSDDLQIRKSMKFKVGESGVIYGYKGDCGQLPRPDQIDLPKLKTGNLTIGKAGTRRSKACGKRTPAVEIIFTATTPGEERFRMDIDRFRVQVTP